MRSAFLTYLLALSAITVALGQSIHPGRQLQGAPAANYVLADLGAGPTWVTLASRFGPGFSVSGGVVSYAGASPVWFLNGADAYRGEGSVGVGTATPSARLHIQNSTSPTSTVTQLRLGTNGEAGSAIAFANAFGDMGRMTIGNEGPGALADDGAVDFDVATDGVLVRRMRLTAQGLTLSSLSGLAGRLLRSNSAGTVYASTLTQDDIPLLDAFKIASGTIASARLGAGAASASTVLHGDGSWKALASPVTSSLQQVTNAGKSTTDTITVAGLRVSALAGPINQFVITETDGTLKTTGQLDGSIIGSGYIFPARLGSGAPDAGKILVAAGGNASPVWQVAPSVTPELKGVIVSDVQVISSSVYQTIMTIVIPADSKWYAYESVIYYTPGAGGLAVSWEGSLERKIVVGQEPTNYFQANQFRDNTNTSGFKVGRVYGVVRNTSGTPRNFDMTVFKVTSAGGNSIVAAGSHIRFTKLN